jgi:uncharacterized protein (TIGR02996 family)
MAASMRKRRSKAEAVGVLQAAEALVRGSERHLSRLLLAWQETRSSALGALIDACAPQPDDSWSPLAAGEGSADALIEAVDQLAKAPADPRIAGRFLRLVEQPPYTAQRMKKMWKALFAALTTQHLDGRSLERLRRVKVEDSFGGTKMGAWMQERIEEVIAKLENEASARPRHRDEEAIAALVPAERPLDSNAVDSSTPVEATSDQLLADIAANLDDDGPRLVYADLMEEQGDCEHAELINLQIQRARQGGKASKRERQLIKKGAPRWLEPILPVIKRDSWCFERGFLDRVLIYPRKAAAKLVGHPLWCTVREVELASMGNPVPILLHPVMRNLRVLREVHDRHIPQLAASDLPIDALYALPQSEPAWRALAKLEGLPALRYLELPLWHGSEEWISELLSTGLARPALELQLTIAYFHLHYHGALMSQLVSELLRLRPGGPRLRLNVAGATFSMQTPRELGCEIPSKSQHDAALAALATALGAAVTPVSPIDGSLLERIVVRFSDVVLSRSVLGSGLGDHFDTQRDILVAIKARCNALGIELVAGQ